LAQFSSKVNNIKHKLQKAISKNETLPVLEKLEKEEFIIDFKERERLLLMADEKIKRVRDEIETLNLKKRVIRGRIMTECWESMTEIGRSIKSFNPDAITSTILEVNNYPIRKRDQDDISKNAKIKRLRGIQLLVSNSLDSKNRHDLTVNHNCLNLGSVCYRDRGDW
jgi:hypothetical protein